MKNTIKVLGIIAFVAIIGIIAMSLTGCDNGTTPSSHNHNWGEWTVTQAATCSAAGAKERVCKDDAVHKETDVIPIDSNAHDYHFVEGSGTAPTCTEDGEGNEVCSYNSSHIRGGVVIPIDPDAHDWEWVVTTPTTYLEGVETEICKHDSSHTRNTRPIPQIPFTSVADFKTWLDEQEANTADAPYSVKVNISALGGDSYTSGSLGYILHDNDTKYVSLDLSGSTFTSIIDDAFEDCENLIGIIIPNSVTSIEDYAFYDCVNLASVTIPSSVTSIGDRAFRYCTSLTSITIPNSVTSIGDRAFLYCTSLTSIIIPNSVTSIGEGTFSGCYSLTSVTIGNSVNSIGLSAFDACSSLTNITIPASVTIIGDGAFDACSSLTSITIGSGVTSIGDWAFDACSSLTSVTFEGTLAVIANNNSFPSDSGNNMRTAYTAGGIGTYTRPNGTSAVWTKQP
jgi:hypothetical protein